MAILNPEHLFEQAETLVSQSNPGRPRQVDLRRAISAAYYGLFHYCLAAASDTLVGRRYRGSPRYALVYRSIDHKTLKDLCDEALRPRPTTKYLPFIPSGGFDPKIRTFSIAAVELRGKRHLADYDPRPHYRTHDAQQAISAARNAVGRFKDAPLRQRELFLTLLVCPPRLS